MHLVAASELLPTPDVALVVVDPRRLTRYLQGHIDGARNVPIKAAFTESGALRPDDELARWLGDSGVSTDAPVLLYDDQRGQDGALLAWLLEYLGHQDVRFLREPFAQWSQAGGELYYRPVAPTPASFLARPRPEFRASRDDVRRALNGATSLIDTRSVDEFSGEMQIDGRGGHLPGAVHIPWERFREQDTDLFPDADALGGLLESTGVDRAAPLIVYCLRGPRASVATVALRLRGYDARLYDGSLTDWLLDPDAPLVTE